MECLNLLQILQLSQYTKFANNVIVLVKIAKIPNILVLHADQDYFYTIKNVWQYALTIITLTLNPINASYVT